MKRFIVLGLIATLLVGSSCSKPRLPEEVIKDANKALDLDTYSATLNIDMVLPNMGTEEEPAVVKIASKLCGITPSRLLIETEITLSGSEGSNYAAQCKVVFDGENQWIESMEKQGESVTKPLSIQKVDLKDIVTPDNPFDGQYVYLTGLLTGYDLPATVRTMLKVCSFKSVPSQKVNDVKCEVIEGLLSDAGYDELYNTSNPPVFAKTLGITSARLYFDKKTHFIKKYEIGADLNKPDFTAVFNDVKIDEDVTYDMFAYIPPEGIQVEDITMTVMKSKPHLADKVRELEQQRLTGPTGTTDSTRYEPPPSDTEAGATAGTWGIRIIWYKNDKMGQHLSSRMIGWLKDNGVSNSFTRNERIGGVDNISIYVGPCDSKEDAEGDLPKIKGMRPAFSGSDLIKFK